MRATYVLLLCGLLAGTAFAENWPQWRGPGGRGISDERPLPSEWSASENIAWKAPLEGLGISTPVVWGDHVFVTSQIGRGILEGGSHPTLARGEERDAERPLGESRGATEEDHRVVFLLEAFDRRDGSRLWEYRLDAEPARDELPPVHRKHNLASPSPVTDGERVYAWFGTGQLVALDFDGKRVWGRHLAKEYAPFEINWGHASSPTLYQDLLILQCDHEPASYLLALDKRTGKEVWKVDRGRGVSSYSTPFVAPGPDRDELIVNASERVDAYDPATGKHLWYAGEPNRFPIPVPSYEDGVLYMSRGYRSGPYMAVRTGGSGDVNRTHVLWRVPTGAPYVSSLVHYRGLIYMVNGAGVVLCVDAKTGERVWQERVGGIFTASPIAGDGKIYLLSENGETIVLAAGREPRVLARNAIGERIVASPAVADGQLFIRTDEHLLCIGKQTRATSAADP